MCQVESQRHVVFRFVAGVAEHHSLVAGPLFFLVFAVNATVDVLRLFVDGEQNAARFAVEFVFALVVADTVDYTASRVHHVDVGFRFYFTGNYNLSRSHERFARNFRFRVISKQFVEDGVRDLIRHFVWVSFRHRFRCE